MESQVEVLADPPSVQLIVPNQGDPLNQGIPLTIVMDPNQPPVAAKVQVPRVKRILAQPTKKAEREQQAAEKAAKKLEITRNWLASITHNNPYQFKLGTTEYADAWTKIVVDLTTRGFLENTPTARSNLQKEIGKLLTAFHQVFIFKVTGVENPPVESETDKMLLEVYNLRESIPKSLPKDAARKAGVAKRNIATRPGMVTGKKGKFLVEGSTLDDQNDGSDVADESNDESASEQTGNGIKRLNNLSYQPDILGGLRCESEPPEANPTTSPSSGTAKKKPKAMREPPKEKSAPQKKMSTDAEFFSTMNTLMDDMREATKVEENIAAEERKQLVLDREAKDRCSREMQQTQEREMEAAKEEKKLDRELDLQKHKSMMETMLRLMPNRAP